MSDVSGANRRDQFAPAAKMDRERSRFTHSVIRAIEELEIRRSTRSAQELADSGWQKLQFDLPLVETAELQALLDAFSASFVGKTGWPCCLLTHKALENISNGARGAGSYEPQLTEEEQEVQHMLSEALANKIMGRTSSNGGTQQQEQEQQTQERPVAQQQLYQQLAAVVLLQYAAKVASLPDQEAWQLMQAYCPEHQQPLEEHPQQQQQSQQDASAQPDIPAEAIAAGAAEAATSTSSSCAIYEDTEAAEQDADSEEYEPLELAIASQPQHQQQHQHRTISPLQPSYPQHPQQQQQPQQGDLEPFSWPALHHKLLSLSDHVHYSLLNYEPLWGQQQAAQHLLQLLRLLGVHSHAQELQPLLHAYVGLLVDRLAAAPQDLPLLHQLWEALGLTLASGLKQAAAGFSGQGGSRVQRGSGGLYPEAVLGLSVAAAVWQQLPGVSARKQLWQLMHGDLLPLLESCAEQLAYSSSSSSNSNTQKPAGAGDDAAAAGAGAGGSKGIAFAHVLLLSHILELLVLGRPGHVDAAQQLTELGVTRSVVQLHLRWGTEAAAEPLRRALLLACCSSRSTSAWVLAVPGVKQQLQQQCFQPDGAFESHGALWQLLLLQPASAATSTPQQQHKAPVSKPAAAAAGGAAGGGDAAAEQQLLALLRLPSSNLQQLQRQVVLLQLLTDAQRAAGSRQRLWSDQVLAALRKLAAQLKELEGVAGGAGSSSNGHHAARGKKVSTSCGDTDSDSDTEHIDCIHAESSDTSSPASPPLPPRQQQQLPDTEQLEHRRSAQLQPTALRLVKELLTHGGGKTD